MSYSSIEVSRSYKTNRNDIVKEFYIPVLKESVMYKRAVGFFSSTALVELSKGIASLIKNNGKIRFIVSPLLTAEDIDAINKGYNEREIVTNALLREVKEPISNSDEERLGWLSYLISTGIMEIKVAFTPKNKTTGMYHEKIGIVYDVEGNRIAFTGSMNETINAFHNNYESIVVFNSLTKTDIQRVLDLEDDFDSLWAGQETNISIIDFPTAVREKMLTYKKSDKKYDLDDFEDEDNLETNYTPKGIPRIPRGFELHPYQKDAIDNWASNNYIGIFDMATGTGKTYTGLGAAVRLFNDNKKLAIIIVCPYQHLVEQWVEDIEYFNLNPTIGYSASKQGDWKNRLKNDIIDFKYGIIQSFCFVTTNATFSSDYVQQQLNKLGKDTLLIIDEAHNFGAEHLSKCLNPKIQYRLALSATLDRHRDPTGTQVLYDYFKIKCIEYGLGRAIEEEKLTPYYYYPVVVYLNDIELGKYRDISIRISKQCHEDKNGNIVVSELGKKLLIERSRIVAGATNKVEKLKELMKDYKDDSHILVYCGATKNNDFKYDYSEKDDEGERQIVAVSKMLGNELSMKVTHFTSMESSKEREYIKERFANADPYQAIVAIKCLDEGVNIPSIKTAFILASSTNPKEYIQRRGRVLRKYPGKKYAEIYDFVTLPQELQYVDFTSEKSRYDISLVKKELIRMREFGELSLNPSEADKLSKEISEIYDIGSIEQEDYFDER